MSSRPAILTAFATLAANGIRPPAMLAEGSNQERRAAQRVAADTWSRILAPVDDVGLSTAIEAYLRAGAPWWPTPGQILALAPRVERRAIAGPVSDGPAVYCGLTDAQRDVVLAEADADDVWGRPPEEVIAWLDHRAASLLLNAA